MGSSRCLEWHRKVHKSRNLKKNVQLSALKGARTSAETLMTVFGSRMYPGPALEDLSYTLRPRQNCRHSADDIFKCFFLNEYISILFKISLKFVPWVQINNIPVLVQIMAWRRPGDKPLSESMMVSLLTYICVPRPQWVNVKLGRFDFVVVSQYSSTGSDNGLVPTRRQAVILTNDG